MTSFKIKLFAIILMVLDHTFAVLYFLPFSVDFRTLGRMAFPLFAFLISEGCKKTKNFEKYILRIGIFFVISEPIYDFLFDNLDVVKVKFSFITLDNQNIFLTLFLSCVCIYICKICVPISSKPALFAQKFFIILTFAVLANILNADYSSYGLLLIVFFIFL